MSILVEEVGEFAQAVNDRDYDCVIDEITQVCAVSLEILEHLGGKSGRL